MLVPKRFRDEHSKHLNSPAVIGNIFNTSIFLYPARNAPQQDRFDTAAEKHLMMFTKDSRVQAIYHSKTFLSILSTVFTVTASWNLCISLVLFQSLPFTFRIQAFLLQSHSRIALDQPKDTG